MVTPADVPRPLRTTQRRRYCADALSPGAKKYGRIVRTGLSVPLALGTRGLEGGGDPCITGAVRHQRPDAARIHRCDTRGVEKNAVNDTLWFPASPTQRGADHPPIAIFCSRSKCRCEPVCRKWRARPKKRRSYGSLGQITIDRGLLTGQGNFLCGRDRAGLQGGFIISRPLTSVSDPCLTPDIKTFVLLYCNLLLSRP